MIALIELMQNHLIITPINEVFASFVVPNTLQILYWKKENGSTLKTLDLSDCWGLNFKLIQTIFAACQKLEVVDLSNFKVRDAPHYQYYSF